MQLGVLFRIFRRLLADRRGGVSGVLAFMIVPVIGAVGMGVEASSWYLIQRAMQNAADSSAMAAATNACGPTDSCAVDDGSHTYDQEAESVAAEMGFENDDGTTVVAAKVTCPDTSTDCYQVTLTKLVPISLVRVIGFNGDATLGDGTRAQTVVATAIAKRNATANSYCLLALGTGTSIATSGAPFADMTGCKLATNGSADCKGHDLEADWIDAVGTNKNCSANDSWESEGIATIADPYAGLASNIPSNTCSSYPGENASGSMTINDVHPVCGNFNVTDNLDVTTDADGGILLIVDGDLNIANNKTLRTLADSGLTVILTGTNGASHVLAGGGTLDIAAPTEGTWSGVAVYQDPALTSIVDMSDAGNKPTWNVTGLMYFPHADILFTGIVNKASNGHNCFALVVETFTAKGTVTILEQQTECKEAGLPPPSGSELVRHALVQ